MNLKYLFIGKSFYRLAEYFIELMITLCTSSMW